MPAKKYWFAAVISAMCIIGIWAARVFALTDKQLSLNEVKAVFVFVQGLTEEAEKAGLTERQIWADVAEKLKRAGIKVVSEEDGQKLPGKPVLYVNVSAPKRKSETAFVYHIDIGLLQEAALVRNPRIITMAITWSKGRLGYCPSTEFVKSARETIDYLMVKFLADYTIANPGAGAKSGD